MLFGNHRSVLTALGCNIVVDRSGFVIAVQSAVPPTIAAPASSGPGQMIVDAGGVRLTVFTYRPGGCRVRGTLIVFHGLNRNADAYRDDVRPLADRLCLFVAAPLFDERRFPTWRYQRGGVVNRSAVQPERSWTVGLVKPLVRAVQDQAGTAGLPFYLIGHSAGAQFLGRVAAYTQSEAARILIANPSTYVLPSTAEEAPYGFGRLKGADALLRAYLARPITLLLGDEDTGSKNLAENDAAMQQGGTRLERGRRTFAAAQATARAHAWAFGWHLVEVPGVGHNARSMLGGDKAVAALAGDPS